ncbi:wax ester/triacylglycerol synthase family O-acyltransferase [soil metagenome]
MDKRPYTGPVADQEPERLAPDDAHILSVESSVITGHSLKLILLEPGDRPLDIEALRSSVAQRLPEEPRATQRVDISGAAPCWVEAPDFDIANHIRRYPTPESATEADLWKSVSILMSEHLDRDRPLWTFDVIGPLADGREAIAARIHHAMADGIAAVRFLHAVLWDPHAEPAATGPRAGLRSGTGPEPLVEAWRLPGAVLRELGHRGSDSPFDRPITGSRELAFSVAPLADLKAIGISRPIHATVNDVLLAVIAGGLRQWLGTTGVVAAHMRAQVPVSLHHRDESASDPGNRDSFMNVDLPLADPDPLLRLDQISAETRRRKQLGDAKELFDLFHALGRVHRIDSAVKRFAGSAREFSVSISNVPGPSIRMDVAGRTVQHLFSSSEPALHHALRISAISFAGDIGIGLCTDPQALPDIAQLAAAIRHAYTELLSAARK